MSDDIGAVSPQSKKKTAPRTSAKPKVIMAPKSEVTAKKVETSQEAQEQVAAPVQPQSKHTLACEKLVSQYQKSYPSTKEFHITSDLQLFLGNDVSLAHLHQNTLKEGVLTTIKIK